MKNSNSFDQANKKILSMILHRDLEYAEAEHRIYSAFNDLLLEYQNDFIKGLKQKLDHFDLSFDEFVHRFNRLYGRYHVLYENRWCHDGDGYEYMVEDFVKEDFRGFNFAVKQHAKKLLKSDYPELGSKLFNISNKYGCIERPYDDIEAEKEDLHSYEYSFSIEKESQRGSS
jgi:hypothetical protein